MILELKNNFRNVPNRKVWTIPVCPGRCGCVEVCADVDILPLEDSLVSVRLPLQSNCVFADGGGLLKLNSQ